MRVVLLVAAALAADAASDPVAAATALVGRVIPDHASAFTLELVDKQGGNAVSGLGSQDGKILLQGSGAVEMASALNWYFNDYLNVTVDWNTYGAGQFPPKGAALPLPTASGLQRVRQVEWSYYLNVCTYGYSLAFVPWDYWIKHIDWMALNGINLPLAFIGQEWLWAEVFKSYNLTTADLAPFFGGPAFLPWSRMGNMRGWGGPLTQNWLDSRKELQIQILGRMRELGMTPVLSAFAGHIPGAFAAKFPDVKVTRSPPWAGFSGQYGQVYMVDPTDPMYGELGNKFIALQAKVFGTDHIYNCDTYNELTPPSGNLDYLASASKAVYAAMAGADPKAVWLMQGWLFLNTGFWKADRVKAYLGGVSDTSMWILDLASEDRPQFNRFESYYGKKFIVCSLLNYGGQQGLLGNLDRVAGIYKTAMQTNSTVFGVGITMEGIWQNYPEYDFTLQLPWHDVAAAQDTDSWILRYGDRRYGSPRPGAHAAWDALRPAYKGSGSAWASQISVYPGPILKSVAEPESILAPDFITRKRNLGKEQVSCTFSAAQKGYVKGCASGAAGGCANFGSLAEAEAACANETQCTAVTLSGGRYTLRGGLGVFYSPSGETSWTITNIVDCHPGFTPGGMFWIAFEGLLNESASLSGVESYRFDLVDLARQVLAAVFDDKVSFFKAAFKTGNRTAVAMKGQELLSVIDDYDKVLSSDVNFMLGRWTKWARLWGADDSEREWLEFNARNQITLWGDKGEINDYARKEWGGLVRGYYRKRWEVLIKQATATAPKWDESTYDQDVFAQVEKPFSTPPFNISYPNVPESDAIITAREMYKKYRFDA
eukprot:Hpha_TRINITY_DN16054_c0_g5::TRINITY_DN16054_c0_g5_i1::g.122297::m.122297/K01205/NAGLU; alpha-N-acetylglucosaminidase